MFIGPGCSVVVSEATEQVVDEEGEFTTPLISWAAASPIFADKAKYPHFSRVVSSYTSHNSAMTTLINHFSWTKVVVFYHDDALFMKTATLLESNVLDFAPDCELVSKRMTEEFSDSSIKAYIRQQSNDGAQVYLMLGLCPQMKKWYSLMEEEKVLLGSAVFTYDYPSNCKEEKEDLRGLWHVSVSSDSENTESAEAFFENLGSENWNFSSFLEFPYGTAEVVDSEAAEKVSLGCGDLGLRVINQFSFFFVNSPSPPFFS